MPVRLVVAVSFENTQDNLTAGPYTSAAFDVLNRLTQVVSALRIACVWAYYNHPVGEKYMWLKVLPLLFLICVSLVSACHGAPPVADTNRKPDDAWLLNHSVQAATNNDFLRHFGLMHIGDLPEQDGLVDHLFMNPRHKEELATLFLSTNKQGLIVHMMLVVPRSLLDNKNDLTGRDLVKSFISAAGNSVDQAQLQMLSDEIYFRDLDLHPVKLGSNIMLNTGEKMAGTPYKIGSDPVRSGEPVLWAEHLPTLPAQPTAVYLTVIGKHPAQGYILKNCRIGFSNNEIAGKQLLRCEAWDEAAFPKGSSK